MSNKYYDLFVGCYGGKEEETIHWLAFDADQGTIRKKSAFSGIENPSFLTVNNKKDHLYAISEVDKGAVISFRIDHNQNDIHELNRHFTKGGPCYLEVATNDDYVLTANYGGGSVIVHALNSNGEIDKETDYKLYQPEDGKSPVSNVHMISNVPQTNFYIATDLGLNKIYIYRFDHLSGKLEQVGDVSMPEGSGPRHIACHPSLNRFYIINEFNSTVLAYSYDQQFAHVKLEQILSTLPDSFVGENHGAHIETMFSGRYLYVSNRGHHSLAAYEILQDGGLKAISYTDTMGEWPRHFTTIPDSNYVLVANEHTNNIVVMKVAEDGRLQSTDVQYKLDRPVCIHVV